MEVTDIGQFSPWVVCPYFVALLAVFAWLLWGAFKGGELPILPGLLAIILMVSGIAAVHESKPDEWESFKVAHNCKVVGKREGHRNDGVGVTTGGHLGFILGDATPNQVAYQCDDG